MRRVGLFVTWLLSTVLVTVVAFRVVGAAESQIGDAPLTPVVAITEPDPAQTTSSTTTTTTGLVTTPSSTTTTSPSPTTTSPASSTTATAPPATTTTTGAASQWTTLHVPTPGGTVTVEHRTGEIRLVAATAGPGYRVGEVKPGPPEVEVDFDGDDAEVRVRIHWSDDGPSVEVRTDSDDD
jgi:cytoskeletal protein RodZ